jgi:simple sugar transport system substrate-binding protein
MKKIISLLLVLTMVFSLTACGAKKDTSSSDTSSSSSSTTSDASATEAPAKTASSESPVAGKKIAYILNLASSDIFQLLADQFKATAKKLGMTADVYFSNGDDATWQDNISTCAASGYDGLFVSHGGQNYSYSFLTGILKQYPKLKIVTFDTQFRDKAGEKKTILLSYLIYP